MNSSIPTTAPLAVQRSLVGGGWDNVQAYEYNGTGAAETAADNIALDPLHKKTVAIACHPGITSGTWKFRFYQGSAVNITTQKWLIGGINVYSDESPSFNTSLDVWAKYGDLSFYAQNLINFRDSHGTVLGKVQLSSNQTIQYLNFTGAHDCLPAENTSIETGMVVKIDSIGSLPETVYTVSPTTTAKDKAVIGVFCEGEYDGGGDACVVQAIGNGRLSVCSAGGNIEVGDYLCSSTVLGHAMKQDDDLLHNYTVAKATEAVDWSAEDGTTKLITCTYHCG